MSGTWIKSDARVVLDVIKAGNESEPFSPELIKALKSLWLDKGVNRDAYNRGNEFQLPESANYFLNSLDRIAMPDYKPTEQDISLSRIKTTEEAGEPTDERAISLSVKTITQEHRQEQPVLAPGACGHDPEAQIH
uniref:Uncharacterized protein n=1 Tax=Parascaris univalens TaxID=6257 RepID=A0A915C789_PARUN